MLGGEEFGVGTYDPATGLLSLDETSGWSSQVLDHYEATYDGSSGNLIAGSWNTGTPGTFTGQHRIAGALLPIIQVLASSTRATLVAANTIDTNMATYWSSTNGATLGETLTLTLAAPARLRGLRLLSIPSGSEASPARLTVSSRDAGGEVDLSDIVVPADPMWKPMTLFVDTPVTEVQIQITEIVPTSGSRIAVSGVELFGLP